MGIFMIVIDEVTILEIKVKSQGCALRKIEGSPVL